MSDRSQGPGWWLASDGRWYPPDQAPPVPPPETWSPPPGPPGPTPRVGLVVGLSIAGIVVVIALVALLVGMADEDDPAPSSAPTTAEADAGPDDRDGGDDGSPVVPEGWVVLDGDGVSIAVPDTWTQVGADDVRMTEEELARAFPDAPETFVEQAKAAMDQGADLVAYDFVDALGDNISIAGFPGEVPLSAIDELARQQVETVGGTVLSSEETEVPAGEALRLAYTIGLGERGSITASGVQWYVIGEGRTYVITVTSQDTSGELADTMVETFRID